MPKDAFEFDCPCCGKRIEINVRSGRARAVKFEEAKSGADLDGLLERAKADRTRLDTQFDDAHERQRAQREHLEHLFKDAAEKAKDDDSRPPNPFDLE